MLYWETVAVSCLNHMKYTISTLWVHRRINFKTGGAYINQQALRSKCSQQNTVLIVLWFFSVAPYLSTSRRNLLPCSSGSTSNQKKEKVSPSEMSVLWTSTWYDVCRTATSMNCHDSRESCGLDLVRKNVHTLPYPGPGFEPATGWAETQSTKH